MDAEVSRDLINFPYVARITWTRHPNWNAICQWVIEHYGLPGDRFVAHPDENSMTWMFNSAKDQLFFILAWGDDQ